jgi:hypothetical protein
MLFLMPSFIVVHSIKFHNFIVKGIRAPLAVAVGFSNSATNITACDARCLYCTVHG